MKELFDQWHPDESYTMYDVIDNQYTSNGNVKDLLKEVESLGLFVLLRHHGNNIEKHRLLDQVQSELNSRLLKKYRDY